MGLRMWDYVWFFVCGFSYVGLRMWDYVQAGCFHTGGGFLPVNLSWPWGRHGGSACETLTVWT